MKNLKRSSFWSKALIFFCVSFLSLFLTNIKSVNGLFDRVHTGYILFRFQNEVLKKTPAGQYYTALVNRHSPELEQIFSSMNSEERDGFTRTISLVIPGMETMLKGESDEVVITNEQIHAIRMLLDLLKSKASPALLKDIENEERLFPLKSFIGMTMSDALDFVNSNWTVTSENAWLLGSYPASMPLPDWHPEEWMHIIHNEVYVEYPYPWSVTDGGDSNTVRFAPPSSDDWNSQTITFRVWNLSKKDKVQLDFHSKLSDEEGDSVQWENFISTGYNLKGTEYIWGRKGSSVMYLHALLYSEEKELAMDLSVKFINSEMTNIQGYSKTIATQYSHFQLMIYRIQIWNQ